MANKNRPRSTRADKLHRRAARTAKQQQPPHQHRCHGHGYSAGLAHISAVPDGMDLTGWQAFGPDDDDDGAWPALPDPALLDTHRCPVDKICQACGGTEHLRPVTAAFTKRGGFDVGCATLCHHCKGRSFLHLLSPGELDTAFARHADHATAAT